MYLLAEIELESYIIFGVIGLIALIAIYYFTTRWVFSIKKQLENQEKQIALLSEIAESLKITDKSKS